MSNPNYESEVRIFLALRMHPWIAEHATFIESELAKLEVTDSNLAAHMRDAYENKFAAYVEEQKSLGLFTEETPEALVDAGTMTIEAVEEVPAEVPAESTEETTENDFNLTLEAPVEAEVPTEETPVEKPAKKAPKKAKKTPSPL